MRGRDLAAWLGLVPKQRTTGGKPKLGAITKRGNCYLRKLLIHGARAALPSLTRKQTPLGAWLRALPARAHTNTVVVALANTPCNRANSAESTRSRTDMSDLTLQERREP